MFRRISRVFIVSVGLSLIALGNAANARDFQNGNSLWDETPTATYLDNPRGKQLPYERCAIRHIATTTSNKAYTFFPRPNISFIKNFWKQPPSQGAYHLVCWVGNNDYAFSIPIVLGTLTTNAGASFELLMWNNLKFEFDPDTLNGKPVKALEGTYQGGVRAIGLLGVGRKALRLTNREFGVSLDSLGYYPGLAGFSIATATLQISFGEDRKNVIDETEVTQDGNRPLPHVITDIGEYVFVKTSASFPKAAPASSNAAATTVTVNPLHDGQH